MLDRRNGGMGNSLIIESSRSKDGPLDQTSRRDGPLHETIYGKDGPLDRSDGGTGR